MDDNYYDPEEIKNIDWYAIKSAFLECNCILMKSYKKYVLKDSKIDGDFTETFNV